MMDQEELEDLQKLDEIVKKAVEEEELIIPNMYRKAEDASVPDRISDRVADTVGSWGFIIFSSIFIAAWIIVSALFSVDAELLKLNLLLSSIAALQAPMIMMAQNRKEDRDRHRAEQEYVVNLKAEIEIRALSDKLDIVLKTVKRHNENLKTLTETQRELKLKRSRRTK